MIVSKQSHPNLNLQPYPLSHLLYTLDPYTADPKPHLAIATETLNCGPKPTTLYPRPCTPYVLNPTLQPKQY